VKRSLAKRSTRLRRLVTTALTLTTRKTGWEPLRDGVELLRLSGDGKKGPSVALLRYAPGARVPEHEHPGFEVIYVLAGAQSDERGTYPAGTLVVNRAGGRHRVWSDEGCLVLIVWERPIEFVRD
jgi:anti-sigma factor ChrR (cupin superfamily)